MLKKGDLFSLLIFIERCVTSLSATAFQRRRRELAKQEIEKVKSKEVKTKNTKKKSESTSDKE